jgi:hypothetical protein
MYLSIQLHFVADEERFGGEITLANETRYTETILSRASAFWLGEQNSEAMRILSITRK